MKKTIGFTCGAFDLVHAGHMMMFEETKKQCDYLIGGLQTNPNIDRPEKNKPIMSIKERFVLLSGCKFIDLVVIYKTEKDLFDLLKFLQIDVRFLGKDWENKEYTGKDLPIKVIFNSRTHKFSSSELRKRIENN